LVPGDTHESVKQLMSARGFVDLLIPRGGASLINSIVNDSLVPVIETGVGNCHVYIDKDADIDMAVSILVNSKASRVSVCS
jgi:glutamate-5-semialdehyde dehydrogenase